MQVQVAELETPGQRTLPRTVLVSAMLFAVLLPLFLTPVMPLFDIYAHAGRFMVLADPAASPAIAANYQTAWGLLPNLGMDLIGTGLMKLFDPLQAARLVTACMILAQMGGALFLADALHGRIQAPSALLIGISAHSNVLIWGFANYLLGFGLMLFALGLWIRLSARPILQFTTAAPLAVASLLTHGFAFVLFGLLLGMIELGLLRAGGRANVATIARRTLVLAALAIVPAALFVHMNTASVEGGAAASFIRLFRYAAAGELWPRLIREVATRGDAFLRVASTLNPVADRLIGLALWAALLAMARTGLMTLDARMRLAVLLGGILLLVTPPELFGGAHLPERIPLLLLTLIAVSATFGPGTLRSPAGLALCGLFALHCALAAFGWARDGRSYALYLDALKNNATGILATRYSPPGHDRRSGHPTCAPLSHLMLIANGTAVPTFADSTQQPIRLTGPLALAMARTKDQRDPDPKAALAALRDAGFDTIVICADVPVDVPAGFQRLAGDTTWALYRTGR